MDELSTTLKDKLQSCGIHSLRQIGRAVGVHEPTQKKKEELIQDIMSIALAKAQPCERTTRGAPPKSYDYDREIVDEIERCRQHYGEVSREREKDDSVLELNSEGAQDEEKTCSDQQHADILLRRRVRT